MGPNEIARNAALRHFLSTNRPDVLMGNHQAWEEWLSWRQKTLPDCTAIPVYIAVSISSVDDIALHTGLHQLLGIPGILPIIVFVVPSATTARIVLAQGMLEGWGALVSILTAAEWSEGVRRIADDAVIVRFNCPAAVKAEAIEKTSIGDKSALLALAGDNSFMSGLWSGTPQEYLMQMDGEYRAPVLPAFADQLGDLLNARLSSVAERNDAAGATDVAVTLRTDSVRMQSRAIPGVANADLVAIERPGKEGRLCLIGMKPVSLRARGGLSIPVLPRFASEELAPLKIHASSRNGDMRSFTVMSNVPAGAIEPWMLSAFLNRGGAGNPVVSAFARGTGCRLSYAEDELRLDGPLRAIPVVWGVLRGSESIIAKAKAQGIHFYYIDHAYFDRGHGNAYRITRNGYEAVRVRKSPSDRLEKLNLSIAPWRKSGRSIIVCPPTEFFANAHGCPNWLEETLEKLRMETDRPIIIRDKPKKGESFQPLAEALLDAHALVTHSSNVAVEAACLGTPVFVAPTSAAAPIGQTDFGLIETPRYPKRDGWLAHLAYSQFTLEEFRNGQAWKIMQQHEERDFV
jgi:hypothetical protein